MSQDTDGVNDVMDGSVRVALTFAGQLGERLARDREQAAREGRALADAEAREIKARLDAERAAARAQLAPVERDAWWETATTKQIVDALQVAVTWQAIDPQAAAVAVTIQRQVQQRYGVSVDQLQNRSDRDVEMGKEGRGSARRDGAAETAEAGRVLGDAGRDEEKAGEGGAVDYDSPARRQERTNRLIETGQDPESVAAVMSADLSQARPAKDAVALQPAKASPAATTGAREQLVVVLGR